MSPRSKRCRRGTVVARDCAATSVISAAQRLNEQRRPCHIVWDPLTGNLVQMLPLVRAACALGTGCHCSGGGARHDPVLEKASFGDLSGASAAGAARLLGEQK